MDDALYREEILEHYKRPHNWGPMEAPDLVFEDVNPLCGDVLKVMLKVGPDGAITDVRFDGHGCAISQAATSMLTELVQGRSVSDVAAMPREELLEELGVPLQHNPARLKCALLGLGVLPLLLVPALALTIGLLATFGVTVTSATEAEERRFVVRGPLQAPRAPLVLEPDASSAAVALAAACLSGGELRIPGLTHASLQGDVRIVAHLAAFGCVAYAEAEGLRAHGFPTRGAELELAGEPDLAPVLAVVAAGAALRHGASSVLRGLGTLPGKESDRLSVLALGLAQVGLALEVGADSLRIARGTARAEGLGADVLLDPRGDHRMAFAFALLGLLVPGVGVREPQCVAKSWSSFWSDLERLGAVLERA